MVFFVYAFSKEILFECALLICFQADLLQLAIPYSFMGWIHFCTSRRNVLIASDSNDINKIYVRKITACRVMSQLNLYYYEKYHNSFKIEQSEFSCF